MTRLLVIISTAEKAKALTGMMYAVNVRKHGWFDELKVVFFGPVETLLLEDPVVGEAAVPLVDEGALVCRAIAEREGIAEDLVRLGYRVEYVGSTISEAIRDGYVPLVF